ncbi:hypothetical protein Tco_0090783 [Tanacetum coccineum]
MSDITTEFIIREILENAVINSNSKLTETWIDLDKLCKIFKDLQYHAFSGMEEDDVVDHIWSNERDTKITAWGMLVGRFFCKYFPLSRNGKNNIENYCNRDGPGYYEIMAWIDSKHDDKRIDRMTKSALGHAWVYRWGINDFEDDTVSSDEEWEENKYGNPPNDSFPKPYLNTNNERDKSYHKENNEDTNKSGDKVLSGGPYSEELTNRQLNEKICKVEKFKVLKYSVGDSEEFLAICTRESNSWAQTVNGVSRIYYDIFQKKDYRWTVHRTK